jgi:hypothetical protein
MEILLGVKLPKSYRKFLLEKGSSIIDGYKILGLPTKEVQTSVFEGTLYLRKKRKDLPRSLVTISIDKTLTRALCLDLEKGNEEDAPLVEVDLTEEDFVDPRPLSKTFREWIDHHEAVSERSHKLFY